MSTRVDAEQIETTTTEKLLAIVLAAFLLVGGVWAYEKVDEIGAPASAQSFDELNGGGFYTPDGNFVPQGTLAPAERQALNTESRARRELRRSENQQAQALGELEFTREEYRTAIEAGQPVAELEQAYETAQAEFEAAEADVASAQQELSAAQPAADTAQQKLDAANDKAAAEQRDHDRQTFLLRLLLVAGLLGLSYWQLKRMRESRSRYLPLGLACVGASAALALVMAGDYGFETVDFEDVGPLAISLVGVAMTTLAFVGLQRYVTQRIPLWRVRKRDCPFCGRPAHDNVHCEGCGRKVQAPCSKCRKRRRVGSEHCGACGKA